MLMLNKHLQKQWAECQTVENIAIVLLLIFRTNSSEQATHPRNICPSTAVVSRLPTVNDIHLTEMHGACISWLPPLGSLMLPNPCTSSFFSCLATSWIVTSFHCNHIYEGVLTCKDLFPCTLLVFVFIVLTYHIQVERWESFGPPHCLCSLGSHLLCDTLSGHQTMFSEFAEGRSSGHCRESMGLNKILSQQLVMKRTKT